jgi:Amt family ammonium transporter
MSVVRSVLLLVALLVLAEAVSQRQLDTAFSTIDALKAQLANAKTRLDTLKARQHQANADLDTMWIMLNFIVMLFMIPGIGLREMGVSRVTDTQLYVLKYVFLLTVSAVSFWIVGYGAIFGDSPNANRNAFIGNTDYILVSSGYGATTPKYSFWSYHWTKAAISTAILFTAFGERVSALGYFIVTAVYVSFIYPVAAHWLWGPTGWLSIFNDSKHIGRVGSNGAIDYSGSCVVHIAGGAGALAALIFLGARKGGKNTYSNMTLVLLGGLLTWFSYYGFTAGSTYGLSGVDSESLAQHASKICFTVTLAASGGGIAAMILSRILAPKQAFDNFDILNGIFSGLVASASGAGVYDEYAGFLIGLVAGAVYIIISRVVEVVGLDDGLRTVSIHLMSGWIGMIGTSLWAREHDIMRAFPVLSKRDGYLPIRYGIFYGGGAQLFGINLLASVAVSAWSFGLVLLTLFVVNKLGYLQLTEAQQEQGTDVEPAVTEEAGKVLEDNIEEEHHEDYNTNTPM